MKKILFALLMLFSVNVSVMADDVDVNDNTAKIEKSQKSSIDENSSKYDFNVNYRRIYDYLGLHSNQEDDFKMYFDQFKTNMKFAYYECSESSRLNVVKSIINQNVNDMRIILDDKQYRKYIRIMNATLRNRRFIF